MSGQSLKGNAEEFFSKWLRFTKRGPKRDKRWLSSEDDKCFQDQSHEGFGTDNYIDKIIELVIKYS